MEARLLQLLEHESIDVDVTALLVVLVVSGASHLLVLDLGRDPVRDQGTQHLHESHGIDVTHLVHERAIRDLLSSVFREVLPEFTVTFDLRKIVRIEAGLLSDTWLWRSTAHVQSPKMARLTALYLGTLSYRTSLFKSIFLRPSSNCLMNTSKKAQKSADSSILTYGTVSCRRQQCLLVFGQILVLVRLGSPKLLHRPHLHWTTLYLKNITRAYLGLGR